MLTAQAALLILMVTNTLLMVYLRNTVEVKSSSFYISLITLVGCYFVCISSALYAAYSSFYISNTKVFTALCYMDLWLSINGLDLVIVPLLFRLLRIVHVFGSFRTTGKFWSDKFLVLYISLLCFVIVFLLFIWNATNPLRYTLDVTYIRPRNHSPYYREYAYCTSDLFGLWTLLTYCWLGLLLVVILLFAIKTRHIKRKNYKDTKKVNAFVFSVSAVLMTFIPLSFILVAVDVLVGAFIFKWLAFFMVPLLCQVFIFMPKIYPGLLSSRRKKKPSVSALARMALSVSLPTTSTTL